MDRIGNITPRDIWIETTSEASTVCVEVDRGQGPEAVGVAIFCRLPAPDGSLQVDHEVLANAYAAFLRKADVARRTRAVVFGGTK